MYCLFQTLSQQKTWACMTVLMTMNWSRSQNSSKTSRLLLRIVDKDRKKRGNVHQTFTRYCTCRCRKRTLTRWRWTSWATADVPYLSDTENRLSFWNFVAHTWSYKRARPLLSRHLSSGHRTNDEGKTLLLRRQSSHVRGLLFSSGWWVDARFRR